VHEILMIHRIPEAVTPLGDWLADVADRVTLVTGEDGYARYREAFPRVYAVPDYSANPVVEPLLGEICRQRPISTLIHVTEDDILRCARVRDAHDLAGPRHAEVLAWRDKYEMKRAVSAAGVATPRFTVPAGLAEAREFAARAGYPLVVKPRLGYASHGVTLVTTDAGLARCAAAWDPDDVLIESYTEGEVFHVDGFCQDGKVLYVSVSRYVNNCLSFQEGLPLGSAQLDRGTELWHGFADLATQVVAALPPLDFCPFHLEVFRRPDGELVFCEIACRLGGAHIMETLTYATGVNPARLWIRHQAGLDDGPAVALDTGGACYGWLLIPPRAGRLVEIHEPAGVPFIKDFIVKTRVPREFDGAHGSTDSVVAFVVEGADSRDVERNLAACIDLAGDLVRWEHGDE
jgi:hypothetical protein